MFVHATLVFKRLGISSFSKASSFWNRIYISHFCCITVNLICFGVFEKQIIQPWLYDLKSRLNWRFPHTWMHFELVLSHFYRICRHIPHFMYWTLNVSQFSIFFLVFWQWVQASIDLTAVRGLYCFRKPQPMNVFNAIQTEPIIKYIQQKAASNGVKLESKETDRRQENKPLSIINLSRAQWWTACSCHSTVWITKVQKLFAQAVSY